VPRLALLLPGDPQTPTGGYLYDRRIAEGLRRLGWEVRVHALDASFPEPSPAALAEAARVLAALPAGELVLIDGLALGGMPGLVEAQVGRLRLIALIHHPLAEETGLSPERAEALRAAERRALAAVSQVVVTSRFTARLLADYDVPAARIVVVEPGTDPAPPALGSPCPGLALLCVAALTPRKGQTDLLAALAPLRKRDWRLMLAGSLERSPPTVEAIRRQITDLALDGRVELAGEVSAARLAALYRTADLFVLPTRFEGYGMALTEALAHGLPVVSCTAGAVPDTVPPDAGILVPPGDVDALTAALTAILDAPALRARLAAGARRAAARLTTWDAAAARMAAAIALAPGERG
jgi:glycosyltransferase involved in cell wall biosynthesis